MRYDPKFKGRALPLGYIKTHLRSFGMLWESLIETAINYQYWLGELYLQAESVNWLVLTPNKTTDFASIGLETLISEVSKTCIPVIYRAYVYKVRQLVAVSTAKIDVFGSVRCESNVTATTQQQTALFEGISYFFAVDDTWNSSLLTLQHRSNQTRGWLLISCWHELPVSPVYW